MKCLSMCLAIILVFQISMLAAQDELANSNDTQDQVALDTRALAVLPIELLTDNARAVALAEDAYDEILNTLALIEGLYLLGRESVLPYADSDLSAVEIGRRLGVANVLEGNVRVQGHAIQLEMRLIDAQGGRGGSSSTRLMLGLVDPSHTHINIHGLDGQPMRIDVDALLAWSLPRLVANVEKAVFPRPPPDPQQVLAEQQVIVLDTSLSEVERLEALAELSIYRGHVEGGAESVSDAVVVAAIQIALDSDNASVRANVWRRMAGVGHPYLIQPLLHSLSNDPDADVREEAAKVLRDFLDEPGVIEALEYSQNNDLSETVRKEARYSMLSDTDQQAMLRETALDTTLTDQERSSALFMLLFEHRRGDGFSPEFGAAMVAFAQSASNPSIRRSIWYSVTQGGDPNLVEPLLEALKSDPDEGVREGVAGALGQFLDEPGVREALEGVLAADTSPLVRKTAERSLDYVHR